MPIVVHVYSLTLTLGPFGQPLVKCGLLLQRSQLVLRADCSAPPFSLKLEMVILFSFKFFKFLFFIMNSLRLINVKRRKNLTAKKETLLTIHQWSIVKNKESFLSTIIYKEF